MTFIMRVSVAVAVIGLLSATRAAEPADSGESPVAVDKLKKGLMAALGDSFEYVGGEVGQTDKDTRIGGWSAERFWFARVRPRESGEFALEYKITFDFPANPKIVNLRPDRAEYVIPIKIGDRGAPRVLHPGGWGGSAYPHANVGDTLIIPIHVDRYRIGHTFVRPDKDDPRVKSFFKVAGERTDERYVRRATASPVVRNEAADRLQLLASWGSSRRNQVGIETSHELTAYLEFTKPGNFNLDGRLADANEKAQNFGSAFRVVPKEQPITAVLEHIEYREHQGEVRSPSSASVGGGTLEVRMGDRVLVACGEYSTPGVEPANEYRLGTVVVRPFKAMEPYTPESKE